MQTENRGWKIQDIKQENLEICVTYADTFW